MKKSTTKRALFLSFVSMFLCFTMLLGTTYAWFTDSVTSDVNTIVAGNLDVELYHENSKANGKVGTETKLFQLEEGQLWEPGAAVYENFTVANEGNLALKYKLTVEVSNNQGAKNLADVLKIGVVNNKIEATATREEVIAAVTEWVPFATFFKSGSLEASTTTEPTTDTYGVVVYWQPSDRDNDYNMNNGKTAAEQLKIDILVNLYATQMEAESDSFGTNYDAGAPWTGGQDISWYDPDATEYVLDSAEDLAGLAAIVNGTAQSSVTTFAATSNNTIKDAFKGKTIVLANDINLKGIEWTPIGRIGATSTDFTYSFKGTFDGNGHTIYNLKVSNEGWAGLFGIAHSATIKDLNVVGVEIESNRMAGAIVGQLYGSIDNCHVKDAKITVVPNAVGDSFDNGDKVGGIVGWLGDNGNNRTLEDCSAEDVTIKAYRDVGGIAGYVASSTTVDGNSVKSVKITADQLTNHYGEKDPNAGLIYGRTGGAITVGTNIEDEESSITEKYLMDGLNVKGDGKGAVVLTGVPKDYDSDTINVPDGVTALGSKALNGNTTIKEVTVSLSATDLGGTANASGTGASGGFFYGSAVEKVVLPEGMTEIPAAAFNGASNLKDVNIPSTVNTIGINAFAYTGIEELTVPSTVTNIGYGAFRGMANLTSVTIEGNINIPAYAFRSCVNLETVIIKGEDVTFGSGMIFTHYDTGDGRGITVYVANETVKDRLIAADTAAKDYGGYKIVVGLPTVVTYDNSLGLQETLNSLKYGDTLVLPAKTIVTSGTFNVPAGVTIVGAEDGTTVIHQNSAAQDDIFNCAGNVTIKNVTFESNRKGYAIAGNTKEHDTDGNITVINCKFKGIATEKNWGVYKNLNGDLTIENCTFENYNNAICGVNNGNGSVTTITGCTFINCNDEAIGYVISSVAADFESTVINANTGLNADNVIGY